MSRDTWKVRDLPSADAAIVPSSEYAIDLCEANASAIAIRAAEEGTSVTVATSADSGPIGNAGDADKVPAASSPTYRASDTVSKVIGTLL